MFIEEIENYEKKNFNSNIKKNQSGFFDLPKEEICNDFQHNSPTHLYIPAGERISTYMSCMWKCKYI